MICVSIGHGRHRHIVAEHRHLVEQGAKLVELRVDYIQGEVKVRRLLTDRPSPVVIACRRKADGGRWEGTEAQRQVLLRLAIVEGVDYIDLEEDVADKIPRFGKTKRIVSLHDFRKTPEDLDEIHRRLRKLDPDIVKICTTANRPHDNLRMLRLVRNATVPTIGICMGDTGVPTRILCGKFGSPWTYATFHQERTLAPGQLSFEQMTNVYGYDQIDRDTEVYGVIADPVAHSLSPQILNAAFHQAKVNKVYVPFRVPKDELSRFMDDIAELDIKGLSVTIPHKEAVIEKLTRIDGAVRGIGAANTVVIQGDERVGYNTDYRAAMDSIEAAMENGENGEKEESPLRNKLVMVLGAGGVGKAIAYGMLRRGTHVVITDGVDQKAADLCAKLKCRHVAWAQRHAVMADVLVNCTPVGMHPNVDETPFPKFNLRPQMIVFDCVYNPENTLLIKDARSRNCKVVTGVDMFVRQACLQFKLFTGQEAPRI